MHVDVQPRRLDPIPGIPETVTVTISNTGTVIAGYHVRVLGADPSWVEVAEPEVSLFPDETRTLTIQVQVPHGIAAGERRFAVQVRELTPPEATVLETVLFTVPEARSVQLRVDPLAQSAGRSARFNLLLENTGNTPVTSRLHAQDAEGQARFAFQPATVTMQPGEHAVVDLRARARRPLTGPPVVRMLNLYLVDPAPPAAPVLPPAEPAAPPAPSLQLPRWRRRAATPPLVGDDVTPLATATFLQKSRFSRGAMSLVGLVLAVTVFALVITLALSQIVGQSAADRNLALEIASAEDSGAQTGTAGLAGTVRLLTSGAPVGRVEITVYAAEDTEAPRATTATGPAGTWTIGELPAGDYKLKFRGSGFIQTWFPQALEATEAEPITLDAGARRTGLDVTLGGVPASISGTIVGEDVSAATLKLKAPQDQGPGLADPGASVAELGATVTSVPIGDDGSFELTDVPSPSRYDLVVEKAGYATSAQRIDVSAGEERSGVEITLRKGDGSISGAVSSAAGGALAEATVTVSSGQTVVTTMTQTDGESAGRFTVRGLPTPASFTVVVAKEGHTSQTLTLTLSEGQSVTGVAVALNASSGELEGDVTLQTGGDPVAGAMVTVTNGEQTVQTATGAAGTWRAGGLALPGTYTVTVSRGDLAAQTLSVGLSSTGQVLGGQEVSVQDGRVLVSMSSATAVVTGLVDEEYVGRNAQGAVTERGVRDAAEATVQLVSSTSTYTVTTASLPQADRGRYRIEAIPPGTYTLSISRNGVSPTSQIVELTAGQVLRMPVVKLKAAASVIGTVIQAGQPVGAGWVVELYRSTEYPTRTYRTTTTTSNGEFTFSDVDAPALYVVVARRSPGGAAGAAANIQIAASEQRRVTLGVSGD